MAMEQVILVDEADREIGSMEKVAAHKNGGTRHRAFSVFVLMSRGDGCCNSARRANTILPGCGRMPVAATRDRAKPRRRRPIGALWRSWGLIVR